MPAPSTAEALITRALLWSEKAAVRATIKRAYTTAAKNMATRGPVNSQMRGATRPPTA